MIRRTNMLTSCFYVESDLATVYYFSSFFTLCIWSDQISLPSSPHVSGLTQWNYDVDLLEWTLNILACTFFQFAVNLIWLSHSWNGAELACPWRPRFWYVCPIEARIGSETFWVSTTLCRIGLPWGGGLWPLRLGVFRDLYIGFQTWKRQLQYDTCWSLEKLRKTWSSLLCYPGNKSCQTHPTHQWKCNHGNYHDVLSCSLVEPSQYRITSLRHHAPVVEKTD